MIRRRSLAAPLALAALLAPAPAQAGFAPTSEEIGSGPRFSVADTGMDAAGNTIVVWEDEPAGAQRGVGARFVSVGGEVGPPIALSPPGARSFQPVVAVAPSGQAFVAWRAGPGIDPSDVLGRWIEPDGSLGPLLTLEEGSAADHIDPVELRATVDPAGVVSVAWRNQDSFGDYNLALRRVSPTSGLGPTLAELPAGGIELDIAALPSGATVLLSRAARIELAVVGPNLELGTPVELSAGPAAGPQVAVDALGRGFAVWREGLAAPFLINGVRLGPDGQPVGVTSTVDAGLAGSPSQWDVSADSDGDFLVSWTAFTPSGAGTAKVRAVDSAGTLGPPPPPLNAGDAETARAALFDDGTAAVAWSEELPAGEKEPLRVLFGRTVAAAGAPLAPIEPLGPGWPQGVSAAPALGVASFTFIDFAGMVSSLRRYLPPPSCTDSSFGVVEGLETVAPLTCRGLAIEGFRLTEPPRHGSLGAFSLSGPSVVYTPRPGYEGSDTFTYVGLNDGGASNPARVAIDVRKDTRPPRITSFRLRHGPVGRSKPPVMTYRFELSVSEPAQATVLVEKPLRGVRKGRRCLKPRSGLTGKRCTRYRKAGQVRADAPAESLRLEIRGKLDRKISAGGRFRATAIATDLAGNRSPAVKRTFRFIAKRPNGRVLRSR